MNLQQLRDVVPVVDHGHFARAAEAIHLSQPALSRSIQALEQQLDCKLLDRHNRGISLTAHGELVLEHARRLLAGSRSLKNAVSQLANLQAGELRLGSGPYPAAHLVPRAMGSMAMAYPGVQLRLTIDNWRRLREQLLDDELELIVADTRTVSDDPLLHIESLTRHRAALFCRKEHPLSLAGKVEFTEVMQFPLAAAHLPEQVERTLATACGRAQPISIHCDNFAALKAMVVGTNVVSMAPWDVIAESVQAGELAVITPSQPIAEYSSYGLISRAGHSLSPAAQMFAERLREEDRRPLPPGPKHQARESR